MLDSCLGESVRQTALLNRSGLRWPQNLSKLRAKRVCVRLRPDLSYCSSLNSGRNIALYNSTTRARASKSPRRLRWAATGKRSLYELAPINAMTPVP